MVIKRLRWFSRLVIIAQFFEKKQWLIKHIEFKVKLIKHIELKIKLIKHIELKVKLIRHIELIMVVGPSVEWVDSLGCTHIALLLESLVVDLPPFGRRAIGKLQDHQCSHMNRLIGGHMLALSWLI